MSSTPPERPGAARRGVIHDLGYRPYAGERNGEGFIARSLFVTGLRNTFGLGRSGKSKILPFVVLGFYLIPALGLVVAMVLFKQRNLITGYTSLPGTVTLLSVFAAAQAPTLFSHDQRYGSIVLYLARPLRAAAYAAIRWLSLAAALMIFLMAPILVLYVGMLLSDADFTDETIAVLQATGMSALLAGMVAGISGVLSAWSTRRGFAVVATIAVLLFGDGIVTAVQAISDAQGRSGAGEVAGMLSPFRIYRGLVDAWLGDSGGVLTPPSSTAMQTGYAAVAAALVIGGLVVLMWRYRRVAGR
jgi:ABC-2 type transport system permease protein